MAAVNPPGYLENGGASYTADILRRVTKILRATQGVDNPGDMAVSQNGTPNMSVNVAAGQVAVDGTQDTVHQGSYVGLNDATTNLSIAASDPTNPRIDIVVAQFEDSVYSGSNNDFKLAVVTGTPAGSPVPPSTPANSLVLAQVRVNATVTTIGNANITDGRTFVEQAVFPGITGITIWDSTATLQNLFMADSGLATFRNAIVVPPSQNGTPAATSYGTLPVKIGEVLLGASAASIVFSSIPSGFRHLKLGTFTRTDRVNVSDNVTLRLNNDSAADYDYELLSGTGTGPTGSAGESLGQTFILLGATCGASATAAYFGACEALIKHYAGTVGNKHINSHSGRWTGNATGTGQVDIVSSHWRTTATAVNRLDLLPSVGPNFVAGSLATLWGEP